MSPSPFVAPAPAGARRRVSACALPALLALGAFLPAPLAAQVASPTAPGRWTVAASWLQLGAAPLDRRAPGSADLTLGRRLGREDAAGAQWRVEAGWLRAAQPRTNAEGVTLGVSAGVPVGRRTAGDRPLPWLTLRPALALLGGRAEAQEGDALYAWRGLPATAWDGQTGTATVPQHRRAGLVGAGVSLAAELPLTHAIALSASVRGWRFSAPILDDDRTTALAGVGVVVNPRHAAREMHGWWRAWRGVGAHGAQAPASPAPESQATEAGR